MQLILLTLMVLSFSVETILFRGFVPLSSCLFQPLEDLIGSVFSYLSYWGREIPGKVERDLFFFACLLGWFKFVLTPTVTAIRQTCMFLCIQAPPLVDLIVSQIHDASSCFCYSDSVYVLKYLPPQCKELQEFCQQYL